MIRGHVLYQGARTVTSSAEHAPNNELGRAAYKL